VPAAETYQLLVKRKSGLIDRAANRWSTLLLTINDAAQKERTAVRSWEETWRGSGGYSRRSVAL
jgi:hypothetical protein